MTCLNREFDYIPDPNMIYGHQIKSTPLDTTYDGACILETLFKSCGVDVQFIRVYTPTVDDFEECLYTESWD